MAGLLLETKFHVPRRRSGMVPRRRLSERLTRGAQHPLTLVSAPAGFGKSTLLTEWLAAGATAKRTVAWLSLDQRDNDPVLFWTYVVAGFERAVDGVGAGALALLQSPKPPVDAVLATLLNDLATVPDDVVLVLDDYHLVDAREVQDGMTFLVEHLPPQIHLVIAGRADPAWPLARMRGRGELLEIRAADLRFTREEAAAYLIEAMGLALTASDVAALEARTEGWVAALQLAALSMQGRDDVAGFIAGFAGDDRYIVDYLAEEVLDRQPDDVRRFLLQTAILDRLSGPLCDAVTGQDDGRSRLEALERANLFVVPLDDRRRWYRYHHLFADVLQAHLLDERPGDIPDLHRRASVWYERNGDPAEAIRHAQAANDFERVADLVELAIPDMRRSRQEVTLRTWLEALPDDVLRVRPVLGVGYVGALMAGGETEGVEARLRDAEKWLGTPSEAGGRPGAPPGEMVVLDDEEFRRLPGSIEMYRAALALVGGDLVETARHGRRALERAADGDQLTSAGAAALLGLASWAGGDLEAANRAYSESAAALLRLGHVSDVLGCSIVLADIRRAQGRIGEALRTYEQGLQWAARDDGSVLRGAADMYVGMSQVHHERGDLQAATRDLQRAQELGEHTGLPQYPYRWRVAMARLREATGDRGGAVDLLDEAERRYAGDFSPDVRPVPAMRARVWVAQGNVSDAIGWARERGLSAEDELTYLREFEHVTLARILLAQHATGHHARSLHDATGVLERLLRAAEEGRRSGSVIEILVLQALAQQARGDMSAALAPLERALTLGEPEGYVRVFVDEGPPIASLLRAAARQRTGRDHARRLLAALSRPERAGLAEQGLIEPLSERELDVLRLLSSDLDGPDIARELVVSLNTVRTHTKDIYAKLGVNNRRAAVRRAEQLDLFSRAHRR